MLSARVTCLWDSALSPLQGALKGQWKSLDRIHVGGGSRVWNFGSVLGRFHRQAMMSSWNSLDCQINSQAHICMCIFCSTCTVSYCYYAISILMVSRESRHPQLATTLEPETHKQWSKHILTLTHTQFVPARFYTCSVSVCLLKCTSENIWQI